MSKKRWPLICWAAWTTLAGFLPTSKETGPGHAQVGAGSTRSPDCPPLRSVPSASGYIAQSVLFDPNPRSPSSVPCACSAVAGSRSQASFLLGVPRACLAVWWAATFSAQMSRSSFKLKQLRPWLQSLLYRSCSLISPSDRLEHAVLKP